MTDFRIVQKHLIGHQLTPSWTLPQTMDLLTPVECLPVECLDKCLVLFSSRLSPLGLSGSAVWCD